jgi:hypothetical protein
MIANTFGSWLGVILYRVHGSLGLVIRGVRVDEGRRIDVPRRPSRV